MLLCDLPSCYLVLSKRNRRAFMFVVKTFGCCPHHSAGLAPLPLSHRGVAQQPPFFLIAAGITRGFGINNSNTLVSTKATKEQEAATLLKKGLLGLAWVTRS
eukprot:c10083_g6_i1.p1 GENE.c10083_g6_i1~~c10083_g6_i1.p1  ORF type:complete len:102 (-),score=1.65 c10083_g6_i1:255-560(-)